jgi:hypothetical protein
MTNKKFGIGILAMALVFGMMVIGCDNRSTGNHGNGNGNGGTTLVSKSVTITGLNGKYGEVIIMLTSSLDDDEPVAFGVGEIYGNAVTLSLMKGYTFSSWTESGSYIVDLMIDNGKDEEFYLYTKGQDLTWGIWYNPPKFNFSSSNSTIPFNQFRNWDDI